MIKSLFFLFLLSGQLSMAATLQCSTLLKTKSKAEWNDPLFKALINAAQKEWNAVEKNEEPEDPNPIRTMSDLINFVEKAPPRINIEAQEDTALEKKASVQTPTDKRDQTKDPVLSLVDQFMTLRPRIEFADRSQEQLRQLILAQTSLSSEDWDMLSWSLNEKKLSAEEQQQVFKYFYDNLDLMSSLLSEKNLNPDQAYLREVFRIFVTTHLQLILDEIEDKEKNNEEDEDVDDEYDPHTKDMSQADLGDEIIGVTNAPIAFWGLAFYDRISRNQKNAFKATSQISTYERRMKKRAQSSQFFVDLDLSKWSGSRIPFPGGFSYTEESAAGVEFSDKFQAFYTGPKEKVRFRPEAYFTRLKPGHPYLNPVGVKYEEWPESLRKELLDPLKLQSHRLSEVELAQLVTAYIRTQFEYSMEARPERDPVEAAEAGKFQCDMAAYIATAILRDIFKIPTRVAVGFRAKSDGKSDRRYLVNSKVGHAWVEVYSKNQWIPLDPTPKQKSEDSESSDPDSDSDELKDVSDEKDSSEDQNNQTNSEKESQDQQNDNQKNNDQNNNKDSQDQDSQKGDQQSKDDSSNQNNSDSSQDRESSQKNNEGDQNQQQDQSEQNSSGTPQEEWDNADQLDMDSLSDAENGDDPLEQGNSGEEQQGDGQPEGQEGGQNPGGQENGLSELLDRLRSEGEESGPGGDGLQELLEKLLGEQDGEGQGEGSEGENGSDGKEGEPSPDSNSDTAKSTDEMEFQDSVAKESSGEEVSRYDLIQFIDESHGRLWSYFVREMLYAPSDEKAAQFRTFLSYLNELESSVKDKALIQQGKHLVADGMKVLQFLPSHKDGHDLLRRLKTELESGKTEVLNWISNVLERLQQRSVLTEDEIKLKTTLDWLERTPSEKGYDPSVEEILSQFSGVLSREFLRRKYSIEDVPRVWDVERLEEDIEKGKLDPLFRARRAKRYIERLNTFNFIPKDGKKSQKVGELDSNNIVIEPTDDLERFPFLLLNGRNVSRGLRDLMLGEINERRPPSQTLSPDPNYVRPRRLVFVMKDISYSLDNVVLSEGPFDQPNPHTQSRHGEFDEKKWVARNALLSAQLELFEEAALRDKSIVEVIEIPFWHSVRASQVYKNREERDKLFRDNLKDKSGQFPPNYDHLVGGHSYTIQDGSQLQQAMTQALKIALEYHEKNPFHSADFLIVTDHIGKIENEMLLKYIEDHLKETNINFHFFSLGEISDNVEALSEDLVEKLGENKSSYQHVTYEDIKEILNSQEEKAEVIMGSQVGSFVQDYKNLVMSRIGDRLEVPLVNEFSGLTAQFESIADLMIEFTRYINNQMIISEMMRQLVFDIEQSYQISPEEFLDAVSKEKADTIRSYLKL